MFLHLKQLLPKCKFLPLVFLLLALAAAGETMCVEREREALLRFKQGLKDDNGYLSSWGSKDECCEWFGIYCRITGHVTDINFNSFFLRGNISSDLLELHHLQYLDFTFNNFVGSIPDFLGSITSLEDLRLTDNNFSGTIPHQLGNLTNLRVLTLNYNSLSHKIPNSFANLTHLQYFFINLNNLGEPLSDLFGKLSCKALEAIDVSFNSFTGPIPDLRACSKLRDIKLEHNPVSGSLPPSFGQLSALESFDFSVTSLKGTLTEAHFSKLENLHWMDLSFNFLTLDVSPDWIPPFHLQAILLARCKMGPSFPTWLQTQTNVSYLDISDAGISDQLPNWLWTTLPPKMSYFNLSLNHISGTLPHLSSTHFERIDVSSNNFSGSLPLLHPNTVLASFSQNLFSGSISSVCEAFNNVLVFLDLSDNRLEGLLPNCWNNTRGLEFLNLNNNHFYGEIPHVLGSLHSLKTLHLRSNSLSGKLPPSLKNCTNLLMIDIGGNKLEGMIPSWLGEELTNLTYLSLRRNGFHGGIPSEICHLTRIQMMDLSENNFSGEIPLCFDNFTSLVEKDASISKPISYEVDFNRDYISYMLIPWKRNNLEYGKTLRLLKLIDLSSNRLAGNIPESFSSLRGLISLNLSRNSLTGRLDPNIGEMEMLESLDLSNNQLSGKIPVGLARLNYLSVLDLANNSLSGQIPSSTQLQSFNSFAYSGNDGLCGPPLPLCANTSVTHQGENTKETDGGFMMLQGFYISLLLGFIIGFWGVVGSLVLMRSWRNAYFGLIDAVGDWLYVTTTMFLNKFKLVVGMGGQEEEALLEVGMASVAGEGEDGIGEKGGIFGENGDSIPNLIGEIDSEVGGLKKGSRG